MTEKLVLIAFCIYLLEAFPSTSFPVPALRASHPRLHPTIFPTPGFILLSTSSEATEEEEIFIKSRPEKSFLRLMQQSLTYINTSLIRDLIPPIVRFS
jgi:hypothetical protein